MNLFGIKLLIFCDTDTMYVFIYDILVQCFSENLQLLYG